MSELDELARLLSQTAEAHHRAFISTDGFDPDWPSWYATYLLENGFDRFLRGATASKLTSILSEADRQHRAEGAPPPWERYYARLLLGAYGSG
ncbi:MAG TPA: hypothetical protein VNA65_07500 [Candidatus Dormibacteraeota bacterium]|nr:hypothetical protein [Candidatus Dormibacteraeota bacterium]